MKMLKHEDLEALERWIRPWLDKRRIPLQDYRNLSSSDKDLLHKLVCQPTRPPSDWQLKDLYQKLVLGERRTRGKGGIAPVPTHEELEEFFMPLTPSERLSDSYKY